MRAVFAKRVGPTDRKKLIAGIHAQASALQLDDDTRRAMQTQLVGIESTKNMNVAQLSTIWQRLTVLANDAGLSRPRKKGRPGRDERQPAEPPTKEQLEKIEHLYADLNVRSRAAMQPLARRITGHPWPQTRVEANKLIEGLKAMRARGWHARGASVLAEGGTRDQSNADTMGGAPSTRAVEAPTSLPAEEEQREEEISGRPSHGDTVHESPITP